MAPATEIVRRWHLSLMSTGAVAPIKKGRNTCKTRENVARIEEHFEKEPKTSISRTSLALDLSYSTVQRILLEEKWHEYKPQIVQKTIRQIKKPMLSLQNPG